MYPHDKAAMTTAEDIKNILKEQIEGYRRLLGILQQEREQLVQFNPSAVEALSKEKDTLTLRLRLLDEERKRLLEIFSRERGAVHDLNLRQLAEITKDDSLLSLRLQMVSLVQGIAELNEFNRILIERSTIVVRNALSFLGLLGVKVHIGGSGSVLSREA